MIAKTMSKNNNFDMPLLRRRAKKMMRAKFKKTVNLSLLDKIWKDWIDLHVIPTLIKYGKVDLDSNASLEIVGRKQIRLIKLPNGKMSTSTIKNKMRAGIIYKIVYTDKVYKGKKLIFVADSKIKKKISEALFNTNNYYRIAS